VPNLGRIPLEMVELNFFDFAWAPIEMTSPIHIYKDQPKNTTCRVDMINSSTRVNADDTSIRRWNGNRKDRLGSGSWSTENSKHVCYRMITFQQSEFTSDCNPGIEISIPGFNPGIPFLGQDLQIDRYFDIPRYTRFLVLQNSLSVTFPRLSRTKWIVFPD